MGLSPAPRNAAVPFPEPLVGADISSPIPAYSAVSPTTKTETPRTDHASCSASCAVAGLPVLAGAHAMACYLLFDRPDITYLAY
jgi:hypothetical protein